MADLTQFETAVMNKLLAGDHPVLAALRAQLASAEVVERRFTGVGFFTDFRVPPDVPPAPMGVVDGHLTDVDATIPGVKHGVGFVLFIKNGYLDLLEGFTYDEPWPDHIDKFELAYSWGEPRNISTLTEPQPKTMLLAQGKMSGRWNVYVQNPSDMADRIGRELFAAFMKCFVGVDRLLTLGNLHQLNYWRDEGQERVGFERNHMLITMLTAGTMHEVGAALQGLCSAQVVKKMRNQALWTPVNDIRARWNAQAVSAEIRNEVAHHLGDTETYGKGVEAMTKMRRVRFMEADGTDGVDSYFVGPWNAVYLGLDAELQQIDTLVKTMLEDQLKLPHLLFDVFKEVLVTAGIPIVDKRT